MQMTGFMLLLLLVVGKEVEDKILHQQLVLHILKTPKRVQHPILICAQINEVMKYRVLLNISMHRYLGHKGRRYGSIYFNTVVPSYTDMYVMIYMYK